MNGTGDECVCRHPLSQHPNGGPCRAGACGCTGFQTWDEFMDRLRAAIDACHRTGAAKVDKERDYPEE